MGGDGQSWNEFGNSKHLRVDIKSRIVANRMDFNIGEEVIKTVRRSYGSIGGMTPTQISLEHNFSVTNLFIPQSI